MKIGTIQQSVEHVRFAVVNWRTKTHCRQCEILSYELSSPDSGTNDFLQDPGDVLLPTR